MSDNITLPREVVEKAIKAFENGCPPTCENGMIDSGGFSPWGEPILEPCPACLAFEHLRAALAAPRPEPVAYFDPQKREFYWARPTQIDAPTTVDVPPLPLYAAPPPAAPEPESKTPAWWMDGLTATLMREGVNKHRAREIAVGYWEAYCQIEEDKT